jgi:Rieske Fe-S protein
MKIKTFTSVLFLCFILGFVAYLDSPYSFINKNYAYSADQPVVAQPVEVEQSSDVPVLEEKLEKRENVNGYIVETYQEYEVYKDKDGKVIKSEPTGKTDTLKYWNYYSKDR